MNQLTIIENPIHLCTIAMTAIERLQASPYVVLRKISCECKDGVLTLKGHLFSFYEKQIAQETVSSVEGTIQVINEIEVEY
jgi:osmotically-inducible protein OsmY